MRIPLPGRHRGPGCIDFLELRSRENDVVFVEAWRLLRRLWRYNLQVFRIDGQIAHLKFDGPLLGVLLALGRRRYGLVDVLRFRPEHVILVLHSHFLAILLRSRLRLYAGVLVAAQVFVLTVHELYANLRTSVVLHQIRNIGSVHHRSMLCVRIAGI